MSNTIKELKIMPPRRSIGRTWVIMHGVLAARSGGRVLTFLNYHNASDAARAWTNAGAHLGADWRPEVVTTAKLDELRENH